VDERDVAERFSFSRTDLDHIASVLEAEFDHDGGLARLELAHEESGRRLTIEVLTGIDALPDEVADRQPANLVSVYATSSFLQLQGCTGYIASEELGEVIFFGRRGGATNGLVVEREAGCSLYANVDDALLSSDFTTLPPEMIMSSVALSMTETIFDDFS
jgi:hypothetical protein